ncbi:MAG TPA: hypothetical protein VGV89_03430 [Thermoplasmata archaeon]|nr:hypothetical protein [Thermoplasmata archaeon]
MASGDPDQPLGQDMEAGDDAMVLASTLPTEEATTDSSVGRLLASEPSATEEVTGLDGGDLREADDRGLGPRGGNDDAIEGAFVGVESDERGGEVRLRCVFLVVEDRASGAQVKLPDPETGTLEDGAVVLGEAETEGIPSTVGEGDSHPASFEVEMKGGVVSAKERSSEVR